MIDFTYGRVADRIRQFAAESPELIALWFGEDSTTYEELIERVDQMAKAFIANGVRSGDRVAHMGAPRREFVITYLAATSIGAIWQGLNPGYTERELTYVLNDAQPTLVTAAIIDGGDEIFGTLNRAVGESGLAAKGVQLINLRDAAEQFLLSGEQVEDADLQERYESVDEQDPAIVVYTSGSTGTPKGALLRHSGIVRLALIEGAKWDQKPLVTVCNLPINHIGCVGDLCSVPLINGGTLVLRESFNPAQLIEDLTKYKVSALFQVPTQLQALSTMPAFDSADLSSLKLVGWGGSALPQATIDRFRDRGCALMSTYGLTEATFSVTYTDIDAPDEVLLHTVGRPDPEIDVRLLGEDGEWVSEGEGEVCLKHPTVMAGYLNRPEETQAAFTEGGWLRTGDIGTLRKDGNLVLVGRKSEMFKSGGYNVYPREIELVLEEHPAIDMAAVVARPDPKFQEVGVAFLQPRTEAQFDLADIEEWARTKLATYKIPKEFVVLDQLPLLPVGKVDKTYLKNTVNNQHRNGESVNG